MSKWFPKSSVTKGAATRAEDKAKEGKIAKGKSSQHIERKAGSGSNPNQRNERRQ